MTTTTLAHALSASDQSITLVDPEDLASGQLLALDAEYCRVLKALTATQALVQRGVNGTPSAPHLAGVTVSIDVPEGFLTGPQMLPAFGIDTNVLTGRGPDEQSTFQPSTGGAPSNATYVTLSTNASLTNERVLTAGTNITLTDGGPGSTITINATGGGGTPSAPDTSVQFNDSGAFGGSADFTWATDGMTAVAHAAFGNKARIDFSYSGSGSTFYDAPSTITTNASIGEAQSALVLAANNGNGYGAVQNTEAFTLTITPLPYLVVGTQDWVIIKSTGSDSNGTVLHAYDGNVRMDGGAVTVARGFYTHVDLRGSTAISQNVQNSGGNIDISDTVTVGGNVVGLQAAEIGVAAGVVISGAVVGLNIPDASLSVFGTVTGGLFAIRSLSLSPSTFLGSIAATDFKSGTWNGKTLTLANSFTTSGNFAVTQTYTGATNVTFPTSGTLSTTTGTVTSIATTSPISGGTITGTGTISLLVNTDFAWTVPQSITNAGIAATSTDGLTIQNTTAATSIATIQQSPRLRLRSQVWNTTSVAATNTNDFFIESVPVSGLVPSGLLKFGSSLNGASATYPMTLTSGGSLTLATRVLAANGSASAPTYSFSATPTDGIYSALGGGTIDFAIGGVRTFLMASSLFGMIRGNVIQWYTAGLAGPNLILSDTATSNVLQLGSDVNGAAISQTIQAANGITGTDKTGGNLTNRPGAGTGAGAVSSYIVQTPTAGVTGTGAQTQTTRLTISEAGAVFTGKITLLGGATFLTTSSALTDGAAAQLGTLATAPTAGNPTKWIGINDNGTTRYIPAW